MHSELPWRRAIGARTAALFALLSLGACIRLDTPEQFACAVPSDCEAGEKCLTTLAEPRCVPVAFCHDSRDCPAAQACVSGSCKVAACQSDRAERCVPYICNTATYECRVDCAAQSDCATGFVCVDGACLERQCDGTASVCTPYRCNGGRCGTSCSNSQQCALSHECKDQKCVVKLSPDGASCTTAGQCASGECCPTAAPNTYACARECAYRADDQPCSWSGQCSSQSCLFSGRCAPCRTKDCACRSRECGTVAGFDCGTCPATQYCSAAGRCLEACADRECGSNYGVACGECPAPDLCGPTGICDPRCDDMDCGTDRGVSCGSCGDREWCDATATNRCQAACQGRECGTDHGVDCGTCDGVAYCDADGQCAPACVGMVCGEDHGVSCGQCDVGELCDSGQCIDGTCTADTLFCLGNDVYVCNATATARTLRNSCFETQWCEPLTGYCKLDVCEPGMPYCVGTRLTTCAANGSGGEPDGTECAASGHDCHVLGCGHLRTDYVESSPVGRIYDQFAHVGNVYLVNRTVRLTRVAAGVETTFANTRVEASFAVYQADLMSGPYSIVEETSVRRDAIASDIDIMLSAGKYYAIVARPRDSTGESVAILRAPMPSSTLATGFGVVVAGFYVSQLSIPAVQPTTTHVYHQDLTTLELAP